MNTGSTKVAIAAQSANCVDIANQLAVKLQLPLVAIDATEYDFLLVVTDTRLELREHRARKTKPIYVDFLAGKLAHREKYGGGRRQLIARAVGIKPKSRLRILDATAGFGGDAFVLATLGCQLTLLERSPIIAALLQDGLRRAQVDAAVKNLGLKLHVVDAVNYLQHLPQNSFDVVYLDPMYPIRTKSALGKKEMRILQQIVGKDLDAALLLPVALRVAAKRVVVKRAKLAPQLTKQNPDLVFSGKSSRFDVYLCNI